MAGGIPRQPLAVAIGLLLALAWGFARAGVLVSYSFDDERLDTGPDTFRIFEHSRGRVRLSPEFRYSGYYAVEIRDAADDGGFPELQGYFPMQASGTLHVHFAFMTPEPLQPFNIALAGPEWFSMKPDGIGFWLKNRDGYFYHVSDSMPKRLAPIRPFTWYLVDLAYRVDAGTYDLVIREEYAEQPLVDVRGAANANRSRHSKVYVFSFIGDLPDEADAVIYVDDIEIRSDTRIGPGLVTRERARETPDDTFFLFEGRAHSYRAADVRIDNIVRGLLHCGVRHGEHVGVLMDTRPSAVASTVALSRLGAVAVLLRPDAPLDEQLRLAPVDHLLADPEHAEASREAFGRDVLVLGGGGEPRTLASGLIDMEAIDPDAVRPPAWYVPNPGRAAELALILVTGDGDRLGISRVTNRRWATSAYGTASACALTSGDTVYCCSPTHHATGMLVCVGGSLVSGARLAMATRFAPTLDPKVFAAADRAFGAD